MGAVTAVSFGIAASPAFADAFGPQLQVTDFGPAGDADFNGGFPDIAFNPATGQHLAVVVGSTDAGNDDIYTLLLDAAGAPVTAPVRVSETSIGDDEFNPPSVVHNPTANEWLVAWTDATDDKVLVRRLAADGTPIGPEREISSGNGTDVETTVPVFSPQANEYLVVWKGHSSSAGRAKGQRLAADGTEVGPNDFTIIGSAALNTNDAVDVAYNSRAGEYLVVSRARPASNEYEVYGQRLDLSGTAVGADDFRISDIGPDGSTAFAVLPPSVEYNPTTDQYLVGWSGDDDTGTLVDNEFEAFAQFLAADGSQIGANDFRVSHMGPDGDPAFDAQRPRIQHDPNANEWLLAWHGDTGVAPLVDNEHEVYGQRLAADGTPIGTPQFRISQAGADGDTSAVGTRPAIAFNSQTCDFLVAYMVGGNPGPPNEVFDRRVSAPACPAPPPPPPPPGPPLILLPPAPPPALTTTDTIAPVISRLSLSSNVIAASRSARAAQRPRRPRRSTTIRYTLSEASTVRFRVQRRTVGRRVGRVCRKATRRNASRRRCFRWVQVGRSFRQTGRAGRNVRSLSARVVRTRLRAGTHRVAAVATDAAGNRSRTRTVRFRVVRP